MIKSIFKLFFLVLIIAVVALVYVWSSRTSTVANALSEKMGVEVSIGDIQLGFTGLSVHGLEIGAVPGSKLKRSLYAKDIVVKADPRAVLFGEMIEIEDVTVNNPEIGVELFDSRGKDNNWSRITNKMAEGQEATTDEEGKKVLVKHLLISDIHIKATGGLLGSDIKEANVKDPLELENVGGDEPLPYGTIVAIITKELMKHISLSNVIGGLGDITKGIGDIGVDVIKQPSKLLDKVLPGSKPPVDGTEKGGGLLDGLFD